MGLNANGRKTSAIQIYEMGFSLVNRFAVGSGDESLFDHNLPILIGRFRFDGCINECKSFKSRDLFAITVNKIFEKKVKKMKCERKETYELIAGNTSSYFTPSLPILFFQISYFIIYHIE